MGDQAQLVVEHRYRSRACRDELVLALYCLRGTHADWYEVRVTLREDGRELATREQARPVWAGQVRRLRGLGYARIA